MSLLVSSALLAVVMAQPASGPFVTWNSNVVFTPARVPVPRVGDQVMLRQNDVVERKRNEAPDVLIQVEDNETILLRGAGSRITYLAGEGEIKPLFWLRGKMTFESKFKEDPDSDLEPGPPKATPRRRLVRTSNRSLGTLGTKFHLETLPGAPERLSLHVLEGAVFCKHLYPDTTPADIYRPSQAPVIIPDTPRLPD